MAGPGTTDSQPIRLPLPPGRFYRTIRQYTLITVVAVVFIAALLPFELNPQFTLEEYFVTVGLFGLAVAGEVAALRRARLHRLLTADATGATLWRARDISASSWTLVRHTAWKDATLLNYATGRLRRFAFVRLLRGSYYRGVILVNTTQYDVTVDAMLETADKLGHLAQTQGVRVAEGFAPWRRTS